MSIGTGAGHGQLEPGMVSWSPSYDMIQVSKVVDMKIRRQWFMK